MGKKSTGTAMSAYKEASTKEVEVILKGGKETIEKIDLALKELFPIAPAELSKLEGIFEEELSKDFRAPNSYLSKSIPAARDMFAKGITDLQTIERWIALHVPAMEDGNNFGVSVQATVSQSLKLARDKWSKRLETVVTYYSTRAEAVEKLELASSTKTETKTETKSESSKEDENKTCTSIVTEEKCNSGAMESKFFRVKHLISIDVQYYVSLRMYLNSFLTEFMAIFDAIEKNKEKITTPKGTRDGNTYGWN